MTPPRPAWHADPIRRLKFQMDRLEPGQAIALDDFLPGGIRVVRKRDFTSWWLYAADKTVLFRPPISRMTIGQKLDRVIEHIIQLMEDYEAMNKLTPKQLEVLAHIRQYRTPPSATLTNLKAAGAIVENEDGTLTVTEQGVTLLTPEPDAAPPAMPHIEFDPDPDAIDALFAADPDPSDPPAAPQPDAVASLLEHAAGKLAAYERVREMLREWLPDGAIVHAGDTIDIAATLKNVGGAISNLTDALHEANASIDNLRIAAEFTANELEAIIEIGYTHAQKNGVMLHVARRLRRWTEQSRRAVRIIVPHQPESLF